MVYISEHANLELEKYRLQVNRETKIACDRSQAILKLITESNRIDERESGNPLEPNSPWFADMISKSERHVQEKAAKIIKDLKAWKQSY